jgi:hypothetical protein
MGRAMSGQSGVRSSLIRPNITVSKILVFDVESEEGKKKMIIVDLNELVYTELVLSIDDKTSSEKVALHLLKG